MVTRCCELLNASLGVCFWKCAVRVLEGWVKYVALQHCCFKYKLSGF